MRAARRLFKPARRYTLDCPFCGRKFTLEEARDSCIACPVRRLGGICGRGLVRCPRCGYESPLPPRWMRARVNGTA